MNRDRVAEQFPKDVAEHGFILVRDDGPHRHIYCKNPNTIINQFEIVTWTGHLCISGDMGTYVFSRIRDMFEFFRGGPINPGYWAEKCLAADVRCGITEFSREAAEQALLDAIEEEKEGMKYLEQKVREELFWTIDNGEYYFREAVEGFRFNNFQFTDFFEVRLHEYTFQYLWCCHAILWGIDKYDAYKATEENAHES